MCCQQLVRHLAANAQKSCKRALSATLGITQLDIQSKVYKRLILAQHPAGPASS